MSILKFMKQDTIDFQNKFYKKSVCIISDCFVPTRNSAAGMIYNLSKSILDDGANITCMHSGHDPKRNSSIFKSYDIRKINFITTNLFCSFRDKNIFFRFIFEVNLALILSFKVIRFYNHLKNSDLIIWYGPSAFLWLPTLLLKKISNAPVYYILRDIFPDWLKSIGLIKSEMLFKILYFLTYPQYFIPNKIGVESKENIKFIKPKVKKSIILEVLYNWPSIGFHKTGVLKLGKNLNENKKIKKKYTKKIKAIYSGNFGDAQDANSVLEFLKKINDNNFIEIFYYSKNQYFDLKTLNFLFVKKTVQEQKLPSLFKMSDCGIVSLNRNLSSNNIPGKFVSYTQFGLPILCFSNKKSTISKLIIKNKCGIVVDINDNLNLNVQKIKDFCKIIRDKKNNYSTNSKLLHAKLFDIDVVKNQLGKSFHDI